MPKPAFSPSLTTARAAISAATRRDEAVCVRYCLERGAMSSGQVQAAQQLARRLVSALRAERRSSAGMDALMHEFSLASQEGLALMCLAEALLRIPDKLTIDRLIRDKLGQGDWQGHLGHSPSLFVNAAAWSLMLSGQLLAPHDEQSWTAAMSRMLSKGGEPLIRKGVDLALRMLGRQFVSGATIEQALAHSQTRALRDFRFSFDMLGEAALCAEDAERYFNDYVRAIHAIGRASAGRGVYQGPGVSVKLSAIHPRYARAQRARVMAELLPRLKTLMLLAKHYDIGLNIDAEESERLELSLDLLDALAHDAQLDGFAGLGFVVQAYQKRAPFVIDYLIELARASGHRFMVRLVKGAYWDSEIKRTQVEGLSDYPVYTRKVHTDVSYLACARLLLNAQDAVYPQFATHNACTLAAVFTLASGLDYEFQCLYGMGESLYAHVSGPRQLGRGCRIYAPVGSYRTLLAYLVRRLLENGANNSFVHRLLDDTLSLDELIADPLSQAQEGAGAAHPHIVLPGALYGAERSNAPGLDLNDETVLAQWNAALSQSRLQPWRAAARLAQGDAADGVARQVRNPADVSETVGWVRDAGLDEVQQALLAAAAAAPGWGATPVSERAACLERCADLLQQHSPLLMALLVREAGKTLANALGEVREAIDFCRYYAAQARREFAQRAALGTVVCISPWNFPLAIFIGQISAALLAGNPVLAKPAEQSSLIADLAVRLLHQSGVPRAVLQCLPGSGETIGAALCADTRVHGVIFTGSLAVAQQINRALAARGDEVVLIAETGGQNAMIVDSSALPEQVVSDVLSSAFDSAGQRCSALRVLYLQQEVADQVLRLLRGAMAQLQVGNPAQLDCDIGPLIDAEARNAVWAHIEALRPLARSCYALTLGDSASAGHFVAPTLLEIASLQSLPQEVFGPVLHVLRFGADELDQVLDQINQSGYGLTHGIHSRIGSSIARVMARIQAGNIYVNRNMIGAVVGVQPFGGSRMSGTGPKAGGPFYLYRLTRGAWRALDGEARQAPALPGLDALAALVPSLNLGQACQERLLNGIARAREASPLRQSLRLPGPAGESNSLGFAARGAVGCMAPDLEQTLWQMIAALACGNRVLLPQAGAVGFLAEALSDWVECVLDLPQAEALQVLLFSGAAGQADALRRVLAARPGALLPLITSEAGAYEMQRLVVERALSINSAALGGNAGLMCLDA